MIKICSVYNIIIFNISLPFKGIIERKYKNIDNAQGLIPLINPTKNNSKILILPFSPLLALSIFVSILLFSPYNI